MSPCHPKSLMRLNRSCNVKRIAGIFIIGGLIITSLLIIWAISRQGTRSPVHEVPKNKTCKHWFKQTKEENLMIIDNYPKGDAEKYLPKVGGDLQKPKQLRSFPVFVTGCDHSHYREIQGLMKSLHETIMPLYNNVKIVFYDLGLTYFQRKKIKKYCRCEIRKFPFEDFPPHVRNLITYAWKPIIIHKSLMEFGMVWWLDASVRFTSNNTKREIARAIEYSDSVGPLAFGADDNHTIATNTDTQTMEYLHEDPCMFRNFSEVEANFVLISSNDVTRRIIRAWTILALNENCIAPPGTNEKFLCDGRYKFDGRCHRFDQSVLGIILRRVFNGVGRAYPIVKPYFNAIDIRELKRAEFVEYFPYDSIFDWFML